jgi:NAD(P)-dependent dehydrogenase (short-subunit alcohol dehydrogenase family)
MFDLSDKRVVVTGGGSGIGRAISLLFARRGARVAVLDARENPVAEEIRRSGGQAESILCDISRASEVADAFGRLDPPDLLVNSAGIAHVGTIETTEEADFDRLYAVNVKGTFLCCKAALPLMLRRGRGVIVNLASIASLVGVPERFAYSMSKGAVLTMTLSIAVDYMKKNIRCNCICPARIHTPFVDGFLARYYPGREQEMFRKLSEAQPVGRMGTPEEVAALALYLCSDEASFITGQAIPFDGGVLVGS